MIGPHREETKRKIGDATRRRHAERRSALGLGPRLPRKAAAISDETRRRMSVSASARRQPKLAPVRHPKPLDIAWAAGIYEGEGTCGVFAKNVRDQPRDLKATVIQKDTEILLRLRELFGGTVARNGIKATTSYWRLYGARAAGFLMTMYTFLSQRRRSQVAAALTTMRLASAGLYNVKER